MARAGSAADIIDATYLAGRADLRAGHSSVLVTEATQAVIELNQRARAERIGETLPSREVNSARWPSGAVTAPA